MHRYIRKNVAVTCQGLQSTCYYNCDFRQIIAYSKYLRETLKQSINIIATE